MSYSAVVTSFVEGLQPDPELRVWEWADQHMVLTSKASKEAGPWRTSRIPYAYVPMEALSATDPCKSVVIMKGSQLGFTEVGNCWLGYLIDCVPASILAIQATLDFAKIFSKQRIQPLIDACPRLLSKVAESKSRDSGNTILSKEFSGGMLQIAGANSPSSLASMPIRNVFMDEIDRWTKDAGGEGSPIELAEARTRTYSSNKKIYKVSTPTIDGRSAIQAEYAASSQEKFYVPCPHCGESQTLVWEQIKYDPADIRGTIEYECVGCRRGIKEHYKTQMLNAGVWIADAPDVKEIRGFYINSLYSPIGWFSWAEAAEKYEEARKDIEKLKVWTNTVMGLPFREVGELPDFQRLYERREDYRPGRLPAGAAILTAGIDVQKDRLELAVIAWGPDKEKWLVDYQVFVGDIEEDGCWDEAEAYLNGDFEVEGSRYPTRIQAFAIDSGFANLRVSQFAKRFPRNRCFLIKGMDKGAVFIGNARAGEVKVNGKKVKTGLKVWNIVPAMAKTELFRQLNLPAPEDGMKATPGFFHFHRSLKLEWFKGLCSEELRSTKVKGFDVWHFEKIYRRNEPLDTVVYSRAAFSIIGGDRWKPSKWKELMDDLGRDEALIEAEAAAREEEVIEMAVTPILEANPPPPRVRPPDTKKPAPRRRSSYW